MGPFATIKVVRRAVSALETVNKTTSAQWQLAVNLQQRRLRNPIYIDLSGVPLRLQRSQNAEEKRKTRKDGTARKIHLRRTSDFTKMETIRLGG
jgi:hypothetical protein